MYFDIFMLPAKKRASLGIVYRGTYDIVYRYIIHILNRTFCTSKDTQSSIINNKVYRLCHVFFLRVHTAQPSAGNVICARVTPGEMG